MKRLLSFILFTVLVSGCANMGEILGDTAGAASIPGLKNQGNLASAVKETLELSSMRASDTLSQPGGYLNDAARKIMLPDQFNTITQTMRQFGFSKHVDQLEARMNKGAEQAAVKAGDLFVSTIKEMDIKDAASIIGGGNTAATDFFRQETEEQLRSDYAPIIRQNLEEVGFYDQYRLVLDVYESLPITQKPNLSLDDYVVNQGLSGLFSKMADEEKSIRANPLQRGSEILGTIFGKLN